MVKLPVPQSVKYQNESSLVSIWFYHLLISNRFSILIHILDSKLTSSELKPLKSWESSNSLLRFAKSDHFIIIIISSCRSGKNTCITKTVPGISKSILALSRVLIEILIYLQQKCCLMGTMWKVEASRKLRVTTCQYTETPAGEMGRTGGGPQTTWVLKAPRPIAAETRMQASHLSGCDRTTEVTYKHI